ncbi:tetratricopeptide repeat-containing protein, partial [Cystoisospora suis]
MEVFSDQYIRIFVELPASSGLILAKQQLPREENVAILSSELHNDHGSKIPGKSTPSPTQTVSPAASAPHGADKRSSECRGRDDRNPKAQETHESSTSSPTLDLSSSSQADATGLLNGYHDSPPLLLLHDKPQSEVLLLPSSCTSSSPNRIVAEVALHETVSDLRWTLLELLPSCFFTNYTLHSHGRRLPEHIPFSSLGLMQGDTLKLVPGLYDERSIRLHLRRFREITGSDNVLLMRELPDPNDPAGPYGSFLKPLILRGENTLDCQADPHPYSLLQLPSDQTTESDSAEEDGSKDEDGEDEEEEEEEEESPRGVSTNGRKVSLQKNVVSVSSKGPKPHKPSRLPQNSKSSSIGPKNTRNAEETSRGNDDTSISPTRQTFLDEDKEETSMKDSSPTETHVGKRGRVDHDSNSCITTSIGSDSRHRARGSPQYHKRSKSKLGSVRGKKDSNARDKKALAEMTRKKRFHLTKLLFQYDGWKGAGCPDDQQHDTRGTEEISMRKIDKKNPHQQQKTRSSKERSSTHGNESRRSLARTVRKECEMLLKSPSTLEIPEKPTCLQSIKPSAFNPPPPARRLQGELSYLEVVTLEGVSLRIICREEGFVVSSLQLDKQKKKETS